MRASTRTGGLTCTQCGPVSSDLSDADTDASLSLPLAASPGIPPLTSSLSVSPPSVLPLAGTAYSPVALAQNGRGCGA